MVDHLAQWELDLATISKQPSNNKINQQYMETYSCKDYDSWPSVHNLKWRIMSTASQLLYPWLQYNEGKWKCRSIYNSSTSALDSLTWARTEIPTSCARIIRVRRESSWSLRRWVLSYSTLFGCILRLLERPREVDKVRNRSDFQIRRTKGFEKKCSRVRSASTGRCLHERFETGWNSGGTEETPEGEFLAENAYRDNIMR